MTQLEIARKGSISEEMKKCAEVEGVSPEFIRDGVEKGTIVVIRNIKHSTIAPLAIRQRTQDKNQCQYRNI